MTADPRLSPATAMRLGELSNVARRDLDPADHELVADAIHQVMQSPTAENAFALIDELRRAGLSW
ncbi:hypothetical protein ACFC26_09770 [Kitasatospora purpeofusca]|uniref:hypothetical protein n=1 Tax=Kitasatospora purpeofusca TaxID=67352 RepID=UPI0035D58DC8